MTRNERREALAKNTSLHNLFNIICSEREKTFAMWLEGDEIKSYDYAHLYERTYAAAKKINELPLGKKGGAVGIAVDTCPEWAILFWGLLAAGRMPLLLDPSLPDAKIGFLLAEAGADAVISRKRPALDVAHASPDEIAGAEPVDLSGDVPELHASEWADRLAVCTSGTTATSRVFVYDGAAVACQVIGFIDHIGKPCLLAEEYGEQKALCFLPFNHIFGLTTNMLTGPFIQYPQVFLADRAPQTVLSTCRKVGVQVILAVPMLASAVSAGVYKNVEKQSPINRAAFRLMQQRSLSAQKKDPEKGLAEAHKIFKDINAKLFGDELKLIIIGGAHMPEKHAKMLSSLGYALTVGYGMTEIAVTSYENKIDLESRATGSVGLPLPICDYKVVPDGSDPNRGELLVKSDAMHIGRLTGGVFVPPEVDAEGFFATGDVVRLGEGGRMWIEGRVKDMIIGPSGENVYPDEIEDAFAPLEKFGKYTVLGTKENGAEKVTLVVSTSRADDAEFLSELAGEIEECNSELRSTARVSRVLVTKNELPTAATIKVRRAELEKRIEDAPGEFAKLTVGKKKRKKKKGGAADGKKSWKRFLPLPKRDKDPDREELDAIREMIADTLKIDKKKVSDTSDIINDLGGDSLMCIELALKIEEKYGVTVPEDDYASFLSARAILDGVRRIQSGETKVREKKDVTPITRFEDTPEWKAFSARLEAQKGDNPYFVCHESPAQDYSLMNGDKKVLNFGSYNYVGMSGRKETVEAAKAAAEKYGTSASGSRLLGGEKRIHELLEKKIAEWKHAEDAVVLVGGHSTNVTVVGNFCGENDLIIYDALAHNSVHEGCRLSSSDKRPFPHNDYVSLEKIIKSVRPRYEKILIVVEGAYSMDGDIAPIPEFVRIKKENGCFLMVDEAHSACVLGATGGGVDEHFGLAPDDIDIKMGTLSKGLGTCGGYIAGKKCLVEYLRYNLPGFVFSVGMAPPLAAASLKAIELLQSDPTIIGRLHRNINAFASEAKRHGFDICLAGETAILPVLVGKDEDAFALSVELGKRGVFVPPAVFPAVPKNKARLRFCVISEHTEEEITKALDILEETARDMGIELPRREYEK